jgi:hypothetical protein
MRAVRPTRPAGEGKRRGHRDRTITGVKVMDRLHSYGKHGWRLFLGALACGATLQQGGCLVGGEQLRTAATSSITNFINTILTGAVSTAVNAAIGG